jgi:hypothetical protein
MTTGFIVGSLIGALFSYVPLGCGGYGPESRLTFALHLPLMTVYRIGSWMGWRFRLEPIHITLGLGFLGFLASVTWYGLGLKWRQARWIVGGTGLLLLVLLAWTVLSAQEGGCDASSYSIAPHGDLLTALGLTTLLGGWLALGALAFVTRPRPKKPT